MVDNVVIFLILTVMVAIRLLWPYVQKRFIAKKDISFDIRFLANAIFSEAVGLFLAFVVIIPTGPSDIVIYIFAVFYGLGGQQAFDWIVKLYDIFYGKTPTPQSVDPEVVVEN